MEFIFTERGTEFRAGSEFDLKNTFSCGQCFRWDEQPDGSYCGVVYGKYVRIYLDGDRTIIENCTQQDFETVWKTYFDLDNNYHHIRKEIVRKCPSLQCAVDSINGIRILSQEPWEALCSFIISQNNNIPRIKKIINALCEHYGERKNGCYTFPSPFVLAGLSAEDLAPVRSGFRARYIIDAAQKVAFGSVDLQKMYTAPIEDCRKELMTITGVGTKVAECTLLYGLHRLDAFPIDVWMKKALSSLFCEVSPSDLGEYAGIAQQYIFHYSRLHPEKIETPTDT